MSAEVAVKGTVFCGLLCPHDVLRLSVFLLL